MVRCCWVNFPVPGRPTYKDFSRASAYNRCGWGLFGHFFSHLSFLFLFFSFLSTALWETVRYRLKYCFEGPLEELFLVGWLFWVKRPLETVFQSLSGRLPERRRKRRERIVESKNVQTTPTRTYCKRNRPLPYYQL